MQRKVVKHSARLMQEVDDDGCQKHLVVVQLAKEHLIKSLFSPFFKVIKDVTITVNYNSTV